MELTGRQKAAMLLMSLDTATAAQMVKGLDAETVQELAVELVYLDAAGLQSSEERAEIVKQFCSSLDSGETFHLGSFLSEMLNSTVGGERAAQIQTEIREMLRKRDPFLSIRSVDAQTMASVLETEHPQAAAVVLSELSPKRSSEVIGLLGEGARINVISKMTSGESVTVEAKARIAEMFCRRLCGVTGGGAGETSAARPEESLRRVAMILRNLGKEVRDGLLRAIAERDEDAAKMISNLMIGWDDIPKVADRSLQDALRGINANTLALALSRADEQMAQKIKSNMSERAVAAVDEEASLMSSPKSKDVDNAREEIVKVLREMDEKGELDFIEE
ncbi:MAG: hypothetical protein AMJ65_02305 [Phycisphaerae bacterium SG8_4]|nr:MAG: hypothetical protein AMJ65_02305 [Phycisphaerae bacterium SG8_4]